MIWAAPLLLADVTIGFTGLAAFVPGKQRSYDVVLVDARKPKQYEGHLIPPHDPFVMVPRSKGVTVTTPLPKVVSEEDCSDTKNWRCFVLHKSQYWVRAGETKQVKVHRSFRDNVATIPRIYRPAGPVNAKHAKGKSVASVLHLGNGLLTSPVNDGDCVVRVEDDDSPDVSIAEWADLELKNVVKVQFCTGSGCDAATTALEITFPTGPNRMWVKNLPIETGSAGGGSGGAGHYDASHFGLFYSLLDHSPDPDELLKPPIPACSSQKSAEAKKAHAEVPGVDVGLKRLKSVDSTICPPSQF